MIGLNDIESYEIYIVLQIELEFLLTVLRNPTDNENISDYGLCIAHQFVIFPSYSYPRMRRSS